MSNSNRGRRSTLVEAGLVCLCLTATVLVVFWVGEWLGIQTGRNQVETTADYGNAQQQALLACTQGDRTALVECVADTVQASQDQKNARQDLYAQQAMARWTALMAGASIFGMGVAVLGVYYVRDTLHRTADAAEAAIDANSILRDEQRPWVAWRRDIECVFTHLGHHAELRLNYDFENVGKTPAFNVEIHYEFWKCSDFGQPFEWYRKFIDDVWRKADKPSGTPVLYPGEKTERIRDFGYWAKWYVNSTRDLSSNQPPSPVEGEHTGVFICITYLLSQSGPLALEGRFMVLEEIEPPMATRTHDLLEMPRRRIIKVQQGDQQN